MPPPNSTTAAAAATITILLRRAPFAVLIGLAVLQMAHCALAGGEPKSCECWRLEECPNNCTGKEVRNLLSGHNKFFESIKRPFVIFFPWYARSRGIEKWKKCGPYPKKDRFWITLPGRKQVRIHLKRRGSIIDQKLNIITTGKMMSRAHMSAEDFSSYRTGVLLSTDRTPFVDSFVAVHTCGGLSGVIYADGRSYLIRPVRGASRVRPYGRPHVIYPAPEPRIERNLRSKTFWMHTLPDSGGPLINVSASKWILNLAVILDHQMIKRFNRARNRVNFFGEFAARLINLATKAFRDTGIELRLSTLLLIKLPDRVKTNADIKDTLNKLVQYLRRSEHAVADLTNPTNATLLLTTQVFKEAVEYLAVPVSMCTGYDRAVGVVQVLDIRDEYHISKLIALAIADMFGIRGLPCPPRATCDSGAVLSDGDRKRLRLTIASGVAHCLEQVPPRPEPIKDPPKLCGNGIIDRGEECDSKTSPCCLADICLARAGVQCLDGTPHSAGCCRNCSLLKAGTVCRRPASECDLPELCDGRSGACGADVTLENGQPCAGGRAFCYRGHCPTLDDQCQEVWGPGAKAANEECFRQINTQKGHCGSRRKCNKVRNTMCGVLHCEGGGARPRLGEPSWKTTAVSDNVTTECKYLKDKAAPERRFVADGTRCEPYRLCQKAECRPVASVFRSACPSTRIRSARTNRTCSRRGVCLSTHRCLCRLGWGGPACDRQVPFRGRSTEALLTRLMWRHLDGSGYGKYPNGSGAGWDDRSDRSGGLIGALDTVNLVIILASVIGGGAFCLVVIFMLCYRRRASHRQRSAALSGNGDVLWPNKGPGYALPKDQLHMDYTDGIERRKRKRKRRGRQRRNSRGKIIGSRYGEGDYVDDNESMERIIKFGSMPSYREDKMNKCGMEPPCPGVGYPALKAGPSSGLAVSGPVPVCGASMPGPGGFGSSGSESGSHCRPLPSTGPPSSLNRNALSATSSAGSPADVYAAMLGSGSNVGALPAPSGPIDSLAEGRHPEKGILKNKKIGDLQELANLLSDKVRHSMGPPPAQPAPSEALQASGIVDLPPCSAPGPVAVPVAPGSFQEKTNAISGSSCTSDDDSSSCSSLSSTGTAVQPPVILCNAGQQTEPVATDESEGEDGSCVTGGEGLSEPEVDQDFLKEEVKSTEGTCWDSAEEELTDGEELLPRAVLRSAELLEDFAQKIPSTNLLLRSLQQQQQHKAPLYRDKAPLQPPPQPTTPLMVASGAPQIRQNAAAARQGDVEREASRRKRQSYTKATESYESLPPASGPSAAC